MNRYINRTKHNLLVFFNNQVSEVRPGEVIRTREALSLDCLEFIQPKKRTKKKEDNLNASAT